MKNQKQNRQFSTAFKKEKVKMLEQKQVTVKQLSQLYEVSETAIRKWLKKYSLHLQPSERIVIEKKSEGYKTGELLKKVADLERTIGQKQLEIDFLNKIIEFGSEQVGFDIKKKYLSGHSKNSEQKDTH
ncbi:MAG: transposase [Bacteroidales bacterium]